MWRDRMVGAGLATVLMLMPLASRADSTPESGFPAWFKAKLNASKSTVAPLDQTLDGAAAGYLNGRAADAEAVLASLADAKKSKENIPLYLLSLGSVELSLGDYQSVQRRLTAALTKMTAQISGLSTGIALFKSESEWAYRGYAHEKMLAHTYLGLAYFQQAKYEDARIEFAQAREADRGSEAGQENDFVTGNFLEGLNSLRDKRYNDAQVSFRKVTELKKDWPLGWYALCRASDLAHDNAEAGESWAHYDTLAPAANRLARDGSTPCVLFMIESGQGPARKPDELIKLGSWEKPTSPAIALSLTPAGQPGVEVSSVDDMYFQASTEGGLAGNVIRRGASSLLKAAVRSLDKSPKASEDKDKNKDKDKDKGKDEVDVRSWAISPGMVYLAAVPVPAQPTTVELTCVRKAGGDALSRIDRALDAIGKSMQSDPVPDDRQVYRFLRGQPFDVAPVVYERVLPNAGTRATLH